MAYNNFYPGFYQPQYQQQQSGNFISVRSVEEAYNWPIAPGNSITFKIENTPYVCTKTKGFSALDQPVFERYRLVKEEAPQSAPEQPTETFDAQGEINALWDEVKALKAAMKGGQRHDKSSNDKPVKKLYEQPRSNAKSNGNTSELAE